MRITKVECDFLSVPVQIPVRETTIEHGFLLVEIETEDGLRGIGVTHEREYRAAAAREFVLNDIAWFIEGRGGPSPSQPLVPGNVWHEAGFKHPDLNTYRNATGVVSRAYSAVDQALWDIWGKAVGEPVYRLLGGARPEVEVYATFGLNIYTPEEEAEAAKRLLAEGFTAFKLQGAVSESQGRDYRRDAERMIRLRETVGEDATIILDGRNIYNLYQATALAKIIEPYNVAYFDEPLVARDPWAMRELRKAVPGVPLACRSRGGSIWENRDLVAGGALDLMGTTVLDQGGFSQSIKIAHLAEMYHLPLVTGGAWHLQNAHLIAAATNGWMTEYHALVAEVNKVIFVDPIEPRDGTITLGNEPGLGLTLDAAAVAEAKERGKVAQRRFI